MRPRFTREGAGVALILIALGTASFALSCRATLALGLPRGDGGSLMGRLLGSGRHALSEHFYRMSDLYFHRGGLGRGLRRRERHDWFTRVHDLMYVRRHVELEGADTRNVLPWLQLAIKADPHNLEPYLVAAFRLRELGDRQAARAILDEGKRANPASPDIELELGRLDLAGHEFEKAFDSFSRGLTLLDKAGETNEQAVANLRTALLYRGLVAESLGRREAALESYVRFLKEWPDHAGIRSHYEALVKNPGSQNATGAAVLRFFKAESTSAHKESCEGHDHDHDHEGPDHEE